LCFDEGVYSRTNKESNDKWVKGRGKNGMIDELFLGGRMGRELQGSFVLAALGC
jgi:hypothetical protein